MFQLGREYKKSEIYAVLGVPDDKQRGNWDTGYNSYQGNWFFFCNIGVPGRTEHDYPNYFEGDCFISHAKFGSKIDHPSIQSICSPQTKKFLFYRENNLSEWIFGGVGTLTIEEKIPLKFIWSFDSLEETRAERFPGEILPTQRVYEGAKKQISVNIYERNPYARKKCIEHYGYNCVICGFNFEKVWGEIGCGYIQVHHLKELSEIGEEYLIDPVHDLRPVCPNCHAMLHRKRPAYSIKELKELLSLKPSK